MIGSVLRDGRMVPLQWEHGSRIGRKCPGVCSCGTITEEVMAGHRVAGEVFAGEMFAGGGLGRDLYQSFSYGPDGGLCSIRYADFAQDVLNVFFHGFVADFQRLGNFLVGHSQGKLPKDFALALGQRDFDVFAQSRSREGAGNTAEFFTRPDTFALRPFADGIKNPLALGCFEDVSTSPKCDRASNIGWIVVGGEHQDRQLRRVQLDSTQRCQTRCGVAGLCAIGHADVENDEIRCKTDSHFDGLASGNGLAGNLDVRPIEQTT